MHAKADSTHPCTLTAPHPLHIQAHHTRLQLLLVHTVTHCTSCGTPDSYPSPDRQDAQASTL
jgi:hypothetical protein